MLDTGDRIPKNVSTLPLALSSGETAHLKDYAGQWLVLYFYPKDSTPGCTTEGVDFNALLPKFKKLGATVLGVSRDSIKSHQNFCTKQGFKFDLVSDADEALCQAFGVIKEKNMYGRKVLGIERSTFLIDPNGVIAQSWRPVKVTGHAQAVHDTLKAAATQ
ncbi:peroxiredoxin Q/BCP [Lysobacter niastensis]|uniref:thioredoxin-dependent peroxiredoxin n=1 Tax=Lysobacter niastensis TaxID=380629 RepID=A0ABU1W9T4_9GAMM|nr:peroxiredoxin [Lysobacter niastensis]MDR7134199.1 peroxiredoxin Q/BCP [Lysobacter niastensis]